MKSYLDLWRRAFDYKGISTLREFWLPFGIHAAVAVVMGVLFLIGTQATNIAALVLAAFLIISAVPFAALTVRRLHDVGKSGWWYFLWFGLGVGAVVLMVVLACSGGGFSVLDNNEVCVYGPPPPEYDYSTADETSDFDPSDNVMEDVYGPPEWFGVTVETYEETDGKDENPATSSEQEALGELPATKTPVTETPATETPAAETPAAETPVIETPAAETPATETPVIETPVIEKPVTETPVIETPATETPVIETPVIEKPVTEKPVTETPATETPAIETPVAEPPTIEPPAPVETETDFDPADNLLEDVYGPPEWFGIPAETEDTNGEDIDPEPEEFYPDDNLEECVYGPPEWFGITEDDPAPDNISE